MNTFNDMDENFIKIIGATYRILDCLPDGDPLKNKAKERALLMLEKVSLENIDVLVNYLKIAKASGFVESINFLVLMKEFDDLRSHVALVPKVVEEPAFAKSSGEAKEKPKKVERKKIVSETISPKALARHEKILKIVSKKQKAQVSDIIKEIPNVTKRTLRRDLDDLLRGGRVVRKGEFNQVFYSIVG